MSKILCLVFFCFLIFSATALKIKSKQNNELIVNGGFEQDGANWISDDIEVLPGTVYNGSWGSGKVTELDAWRGNTRINQKFNLHAGQKCHFKFDFAARQGVSGESNSFSVWWNNEVVERVTPGDYNVNKKNYDLTAKEGENIVGIQGEGSQDTLGMTIDNVSLKCNPAPAVDLDWKEGHEYIINGTFDDPDTKKGWIATDYEVLPGPTYNGANTTGNVNELDAWAGNTKITQKFRVKTAGGYKLEFDTAARNGVPLPSNGLKVTFNGKEIFAYTPADYNRHHHTFDVDGIAGENVLDFEGTGPSDGLGITLDNVSLKGHTVVIELPPTPTPTPTDECS